MNKTKSYHTYLEYYDTQVNCTNNKKKDRRKRKKNNTTIKRRKKKSERNPKSVVKKCQTESAMNHVKRKKKKIEH